MNDLTQSIPEHRKLVAEFDGPNLRRGRVPVPEFISVIDGLQKVLLIVGQDLMGRQHTRGPVPQTYTEQLTFDLVATAPGSFRATLALPDQAAPDLLNLGEEA